MIAGVPSSQDASGSCKRVCLYNLKALDCLVISVLLSLLVCVSSTAGIEGVCSDCKLSTGRPRYGLPNDVVGTGLGLV